MHRRQYLKAAGSVGLALVAGCTASGSTDVEGEITVEKGTETPAPPYETDFEGAFTETRAVQFADAGAIRDDYTVRLQGVVANASDTTLRYVEVRGYFYDSDGVRLGDSLDNTMDLAPGERWEYDIPFLGDDDSRVSKWRVVADARG